MHGEFFTGCAVRFAVKISQEYCASEQWSVMQRTCEDCERMLLKIEGPARVGEIMIFGDRFNFMVADLELDTECGAPAEEDSPCWRLNRAEHISARHDQLAFLSRSDLSPQMPSKFSRYRFRVTSVQHL